ncbi:MAG: nuclear transport factor 2 family protein [Acidimicrobiaceae bacterium]|jgi:3-phenylpropionate/cinnamic acid dioxygenase small subunit|nr:nuclear transport factor 2 family protein [Acidimicrobiaceae bacterium]MBT5579285.1 nuclear transport factor 2 family protein [Acidimicrobiaceae bacterium]MBT5852268.1 nuclear transport factor 2 family protein [Acidimicrobiaceae bacterium]
MGEVRSAWRPYWATPANGLRNTVTITSDETAITNLLYRYAEAMDAGDLNGAADLLRHADIILTDGDSPIGADDILDIWNDRVILHHDGTPRTKHVITNVIVEIADDRHSATARSYYTVLQQIDNHPLAPIIAGRYHDVLAKVDDVWRFAQRDYSLVDLVGDLSHHLAMGPASPHSADS